MTSFGWASLTLPPSLYYLFCCFVNTCLVLYLDWFALSQVSMSHLFKVQEQRITKEDLAFDDMEPDCRALAGFGSTSSMVGFALSRSTFSTVQHSTVHYSTGHYVE